MRELVIFFLDEQKRVPAPQTGFPAACVEPATTPETCPAFWRCIGSASAYMSGMSGVFPYLPLI